jgi:signal transduction histidine kinase
MNRQHHSSTLPTPLHSRRFFAGLFLAAYAVLVVDLLTRVEFVHGWPTLLLGAAYVLTGTFGFARVERAVWPTLRYNYFGLMIPLGAGLFARSPTGGTFLLLVVVAQSIRILPSWGVLLIGLPLPLLHATMSWPDSLRESTIFLVALVFLYVLSRAIRDAERARDALAAANHQLRTAAAQREELATERERNRIAREIHDGLGHYLTTIHMQIQAARSILATDRPRADSTLAKAQHLSQEALGDVRRSVGILRAGPAQRPSLPRALLDLAAAAEATGLPTTVTVMGAERPLEPQQEQALYRAAQEGLTNARKHAQASSVTLMLDYGDAQWVRLTVADDGCGTSTTSGGFGLIGLRERVQLVGGSFTLRTAPGAGLALIVEVPA